MKVFCEIVILFLLQKLFCLVLLNDVMGQILISSNSTGYLQNTFYCEIADKILSLNCTITVQANNIRYSLGGCYEYHKNDLTIVLDQTTDLKSFECISENPFTINFDFGSEKPRIQFTKFKRERISQNFFDPNSYLFKMKMVVPRNQRYEIEDDQTSWFTYTLLSWSRLLKHHTMKIRFCVQSSQAYSYRIRPVSSSSVLNYFPDVPSATTIDVTDSVIRVPCNPPFEVSLYLLEGIKNSNKNGTCPDSLSKIKLSNSSLSQWNSVEGFKVNLSSLWNINGTLICVRKNLERDPSKWISGLNCISYGLQFPPSVQTEPINDLIRYKTNLTKSETSLSIPENVHLMCSSTKTNVTMLLRYEYKEEIDIMPKHYEVSEPEHRYVTEVELSYFVLKNLKQVRNQWNTLTDDFRVDCVESSNKTNKLQTWSFLKDSFATQLTYEPSLDRFMCHGESLNYVPLLQIECDDIYECRTWERSLQNKKTRECSNHQFVPFLKGTACDVPQVKEGRWNNAFCVSASPIKKALVQCSPPGEQPVNEVYFKGFDGLIYTRSDVPTEAILKLECFNQESYVLFEQTVTCSCEGHSFFHSHGIQWLLVFTNDSIQSLPKDMISYQDLPKSRDEYNPLSIVDIWFKFKDIKSIICAVPLLNTKEWQNTTKTIQVLDAMTPKIFSFESKKEISVGEKGQSLSCAGEGRPTPKVEWSRNNRPIETPLIVVSQGISKLLIFPDYNDKLNGEYLCTATNTKGSDKKHFTISTKKQSNFGIGSILALTIATGLLIAVLPTFYLLRRLRASQQLVARLTDSEIDEFFNGVESLQFTQSEDNAFALPYEPRYELDKDSFEINKKQILGSGEFGTVYKGNIYSYKGDFAFKTTKNICTPEVLKGLLSELKIMMYVGEHENIVKLVGAYTKDIKNGVLYIATELCSLGSLLSYLRKMKLDIPEGCEFQKTKLFLKCLRWSEEIANGMDYLSIKHVIHSDLAARNILLTEGEVVKISDFGLSRRMYNYCDYKKTDKTNALPWKWMAIESLREMTFSTHSDVWAYGVTIWEIFSLGNAPYPGISWTIEFVDMLEQGLRNLKPKYATTKLYDIMLSCWEKNPTDRPEFRALRYFFVEYRDEDLNVESLNSPKSEELYIKCN